MKNGFREKLGRERIFWDGGLGTQLQSRGLAAGELPETWNLKHPDALKSIHKDYLLAGCHVIDTNTFGANRLKYPRDLKEIVEAGVGIAREAARETSAETGREDIFVALDVGPTGKLLRPLGDLDFEEAVDIFGEVARIGAAAGADLILIETMSDTYELKAAVLAAKENTDLPVCATVTLDAGGKLLTGGDVKTCVALLEGLGIDALGVNCSLGPEELLPVARELVALSSVPVIITPNAGLPRSENGSTVYDVDPDAFAERMAEIAACGVQAMGGCCGTTPAHIRRMTETCKDIPFHPATEKQRTFVTSYARSVEIGVRPRIIGERINPTGKKAFKEALKTNDIAYILQEGVKQEDAGADILDVNVGLPEIDEAEMMGRVITELQGVTALPLQIDTADAAALSRGLRLYNGKPLVNSVNGNKESMDAVFPLVAKYGGVVVALTLDEDGIPETAEGRIRIAEKIVAEAAKYGIAKKDIVIDALALAISSGKEQALVTLETVERARRELGLATILGVSNVSFGLPAREQVNASFLSMALAKGLTLAILNPCNETVLRAFRASMALLDHDESCAAFVDAYRDYEPAAGAQGGSKKTPGADAPKEENGERLRACIEKGLIDKAGELAKLALHTRAPLDVVNQELVPALDTVGQGFEKGSVFLPQLLMSAEAAQAAFDVIREALPEKTEGEKEKVILATVKGDIHDIGKNIVKVLLENYGFDVLDLGKDVAPETICETAKEQGIRLVGLSALMTTTVASMRETIELLRKTDPAVKVVVGGAALSREYADAMGADHYAKDAMETVRYAEKLLLQKDTF